MSKIICDVCGTSYPDTSAQCPICGNAKSEAAVSMGTVGTPYDENYAYVKGGRFSHANVRKMNSGKKELPRTVAPAKPVEKSPEPAQPRQSQPAPQEPVAPPAPRKEGKPREEAPVAAPRRREREERKKRNTGNAILWIIIVLLVIAILAVCGFIAVRLLSMYKPMDKTTTTTSTTTTQTTPGTSSTVNPPISIPCTSIRVPMPSYTFNAIEDTLLLDPIKQPANTTDPVLYESSDPRIATVDADGVVRPVADGYVTITITCGDVSTTCEITCRVGVDPTEPTVRPTDPIVPPTTTNRPTKPFIKLELNRSDFTLTGYGSTHNLYSGELDPAAISWTSTDESVATVTNGIVKAVGNGNAKIIAEFEGQRVECAVHCANVVVSTYELHNQWSGFQTDITMRVGEKIRFFVINVETKEKVPAADVTFSVSDEAYITVDEKGNVTAVAPTAGKTVYLIAEYQGITYKCRIIVRS